MASASMIISSLNLVYPPVSNQEADWLVDDEEAVAWLRRSDFYFIGARAEATFENIEVGKGDVLTFDLVAGEHLKDKVIVDAAQMAEGMLGYLPEDLTLHVGDKVVRLFRGTEREVEHGTAELIEWFTSEKLIQARANDQPGIGGLQRFREFATYDLLYAGIARTADTYERLFAGAHHARQKILTNEWARRPHSRVSDEMILFPMKVEPMTIRFLDEADTVTTSDADAWKAFSKMVVRDAEKAFIHLLEPQYNVEKFAAYPRSVDGLWGKGFQRYGFVIAENMTFEAVNGGMRGSRDPVSGSFTDLADMIVVSGEDVAVLPGS